MAFSNTHPADSYRPRQTIPTSEFKARLETSLTGYYSGSNSPHYRSVTAALFLWDNDDIDLKCSNEVNRLYDTFKYSYGYDARVYQIPSNHKCPELWLNETCYDIMREKTERDLIIVYYAGHGDTDSSYSPCIWVSGVERVPYPLRPNQSYDRKATLDFRPARDALCKYTDADVLFLLDCCHVSGAAIGGNRKELIAASAIESVTKLPGYNSFTTAVVQEMEHAATNKTYLSAAMLYARLVQKTFNDSLASTPVHVEMAPETRLSIMLIPQSTSGSLHPATWPNTIPIAAVLQVQLRDATEHTLKQPDTWATKSKPPGISKVSFRSWWRSTSATLIFEIPIEAWYCLSSHPSISFVSFRALPSPVAPTPLQQLPYHTKPAPLSDGSK